MKSSIVKLRKSQRKTNYTRQNENSLDGLGSNITSNIIKLVFINMKNLCSFIFAASVIITCKSVSKRSRSDYANYNIFLTFRPFQ